MNLLRLTCFVLKVWMSVFFSFKICGFGSLEFALYFGSSRPPSPARAPPQGTLGCWFLAQTTCNDHRYKILARLLPVLQARPHGQIRSIKREKEQMCVQLARSSTHMCAARSTELLTKLKRSLLSFVSIISCTSTPTTLSKLKMLTALVARTTQFVSWFSSCKV